MTDGSAGVDESAGQRGPAGVDGPGGAPEVDGPSGSAEAGGPSGSAEAGGRLAGWRVLVPRAGEWGERVDRLLAAEGATAVVVPLITFAPPHDVDALDEALRRLADGGYAWLTMTSGTTVTALVARAVALVGGSAGDALARVLGGARVAAVGPGTARALERAGVVPDLVPSGERSARGLVADFPAPGDAPGADGRATRLVVPEMAARGPGTLTGGRVLSPHSDIAEPTLVDGLRAAGWAVDDVVAYRTLSGPVPPVEVREDMRAGAFDAVLLSSASTVTAMLELVGPPPSSTLVACIGPRTEQAAVEHGLQVHVRPAMASAEELVEALARHAQDHGGTGARPGAGRPEESPS